MHEISNLGLQTRDKHKKLIVGAIQTLNSNLNASVPQFTHLYNGIYLAHWVAVEIRGMLSQSTLNSTWYPGNAVKEMVVLSSSSSSKMKDARVQRGTEACSRPHSSQDINRGSGLRGSQPPTLSPGPAQVPSIPPLVGAAPPPPTPSLAQE